MVLEDQVVLFYIFSSRYASSFDMLDHHVVLQHWVEMAERDRCQCAVGIVVLFSVATVVLHDHVVLFSVLGHHVVLLSFSHLCACFSFSALLFFLLLSCSFCFSSG